MTAMIDITNAEKTFTMHLQGGVELPVVRGVSSIRSGSISTRISHSSAVARMLP
jgi:alpha-D-ribose 1-methylphosphonate 5-triphosphate synthase subunit PhnL